MWKVPGNCFWMLRFRGTAATMISPHLLQKRVLKASDWEKEFW